MAIEPSATQPPIQPEPSKPNEPKTVEPRTPYYFDAVKILGTGNSTGLFGALVAFYYFAKQGGDVPCWIKVTATFYLFGVCLFTLAFFFLYKFSMWQLRPAPELLDPKNVESRVKFWRSAALTAGASSLIAWWFGTAAAVRVLCLLVPNP